MSYAGKYLDELTMNMAENKINQTDTDENKESPIPITRLKINEHKPFEMRIPVPWGHISAKCFGDSKGSPILAVHGWMDNAGSFDKLARYLPSSFYLVAVDLPGHGRSSHLPPGIPYHYSDFVMSLRRITNYFKWTKFSWIGHSMGAGLGALYASVFPSDVDKLIMIDLVKPITGDSNNYAAKISMAIDTFIKTEAKISPVPPSYSYHDALDRLMKATDDSLNEEAAKILLVRGSRQVDEEQWCFSRDLRLRNPSIMRFSHEQCFSILREIRCQMLVIKAKDAPWFEPKEICDKALEIYREHASSFQFVEVDGNHFIHLNEPEKIAPMINDLLLRQKSGL